MRLDVKVFKTQCKKEAFVFSKTEHKKTYERKTHKRAQNINQAMRKHEKKG